jgi:hypothetical protein
LSQALFSAFAFPGSDKSGKVHIKLSQENAMSSPKKVLEFITNKGPELPLVGGSGPLCDDRKILETLGAELLRRAEESQSALGAAWDDLMAQWGVQGPPIPIQRLREMFEEDDGSKLDNKSLSSELIAIREESRP